MLVRKHFFSKGFRYRKHDRRYPETPDIVATLTIKLNVFTGRCLHGKRYARGKIKAPRT
ncbi:MAG: hypothetical protein P9L89_02870 [Candidatus Celaenobacter polaris]|nr:hypothetical protein [Candidatus Celaenobacter polaris]